jgi:hypothetical protein
MTLPDEAWFPASPMGIRQKIPGPELAKHSAPLLEALEAVCKSTPFRTSPKSCEFLRHIVLRSLDGDTDELKERLIGMVLLGRDASYDTATDAGVRVRANDVRKRLHVYNESLDSTAKYCFGLPPGTYVPVFYCSLIESPIRSPIESPAQETASSPALSLYRLATPALVALFLCVIFLRSEFAQSHSFLLFWNHVLPDGEALLYLQPLHASGPVGNPASEAVNGPNRPDGPQDEMDLRALKFAAPLLDLAGQLHHRLTLVGTPAQAADGRLVYVGAAESPAGQPDSLSGLPDTTAAGLASRFVVRATPAGRRILDRQLPQSNGTSGALLTIVNGPRLLIWIDGVDDDAIRMLVNRLCDQSTFPTVLADSFQPYTMTQAVFPASPHSEPAVVRMPFRGMQATHEVAQ